MGARPLSMGSALAANADGAGAIFWNPAGVAHINGHELVMSYVELYGLVSYNSLSYAQLIKNIPAGIGFVSSSDIDGVYQENILFFSAAKEEIYSNLNLGGNIKYLSSSANTDDINIGGGRGFALDIGGQYHGWNDMIFFGASFQNLISYVSYNRKKVKDIPGEKYSEGLDFSYRLGASINLEYLTEHIPNTFLATDISDGRIHIGAEYIFREIIAIRAGINTGNSLTKAITSGFGLKLADFELDYAYIGSGVGAQTSQFSLTLNW